MENSITCVLIDDEEHCTDTLQLLLAKHCPHVLIEGVFNSSAEGLKFLQNNKVDIIFLDIEMPVLNAFDLLRALGPIEASIVFTTAYDEHAIKAIKHNALDYLLKPVDIDELKDAVGKVQSGNDLVNDRIDKLLEQFSGSNQNGRLAIPTREGLEVVDIDEIKYAKSDDNYTELHLSDGSKKVISKTLKSVEKELPEKDFLRVHQSYLVASKEIEKYVRGSGGYLVIRGGIQIPVSRAKKESLLKHFGISRPDS